MISGEVGVELLGLAIELYGSVCVLKIINGLELNIHLNFTMSRSQWSNPKAHNMQMMKSQYASI